MIIVPTIPATGTHFLLKMLGVKPNGMMWNAAFRSEGSERDVAYGHIYPRSRHIFMPLIRDNLTIIPLRHPFVVARSWQQRGMNLLELVVMFELLINEIDPCQPFYLPIDAPTHIREERLQYISAWIGLDIETDWEPVESKNGNGKLRYQDIEGNPLMVDLVDKYQQFFERFYP